MAKLIVENLGWIDSRFKSLQKGLVPLVKDISKEIGLKSNIIVHLYKNKNKDLINKLRESFLSTIIEVPIAQKRVRLERTEELYGVAEEVDTKLKCLKEAREEVEGKGAANLTFQQFNQYNQLSDEELRDKLREVELKIIKTNVVEA